MKKLFFIAFMLFSSFLIKAENPFSLGVKLGYTYADIATLKTLTHQSVLHTIKSDGSNGSVFGAYARIGGERLYFQPELIYVTQKSNFKSIVKGALNQDNVELKLTTLDVPLQVGVRILNLSLVKLRLFAGPCVSIKIDNKFKFKKDIKALASIARDDFKSLNWSARGGIGVDVGRFNLDIAYQYGFTDIAKRYFKKPKLILITLGFSIL